MRRVPIFFFIGGGQLSRFNFETCKVNFQHLNFNEGYIIRWKFIMFMSTIKGVFGPSGLRALHRTKCPLLTAFLKPLFEIEGLS